MLPLYQTGSRYEPPIPPAFARRFGRSVLDAIRPFYRSSNYQWRGIVAPGVALELFGARQQVETHYALRPGSYLQAVSVRSSAFPTDCQFDITDRGTGDTLSSQRMRFGSSNGPLYLPAPWVIKSGDLLVRITYRPEMKISRRTGR